MNTTPPGGEYAPHLHEHRAPGEPARPVRAAASAAAPTRLADEFFYLAHDDQTGRSRLFESATAHGLAAALLLELYGEGRITFEGRHIRVIDTLPPRDWLRHLVLDRLVAEPRHTATRTWLAFLGTTAYEQVATRMWQRGFLRQQQVGRLWRQRIIYIPTDVNTAAWSWARLSYQLRRYQRLNAFDAALAGLALHTALDPILLDGAPQATRAFLREQVNQTPLPLRDLLADLGAVVGGAVLSHRTT
ncbi:GOLPH3/VPS74 family protein [Micromonospora endophytica]|uniref:GPP34 family phosphoprotein n=1 Tax=Micromonospora endophytica TaxID=515350 RepID=A0A2W2E393_9ACTN|nr:GPP34 family phosphoprotein [Micromonospora endophytica]PZF99423.1 GPP34 family phosphoprotein [Micromonospora endophytica]RIW42920.1 GPP34 family phosphoprotein [Micromonospora endophytica]